MASVTGCTFFKVVRYRNSDIDDYRLFPKRELTASSRPFRFEEGGQSTSGAGGGSEAEDLSGFLSAHDTTAFLVVHDDAILFEEYYNGGAVDRPTFAFSMTKSFTSVLVGCAVSDGIIESVDQPVTDYVPELASAGFDEVKIEHLLQMTSGMQYRESGSPFRQHPYFYYGDDLEQRLLEQKLAAPPGTEFGYKSGENQLLGLVLDRALGEETITHYMQRRVWDPLGMEFGGSWAVDHEPGGLEKTFCCLSMTARDIAKMGRLYKNDGVWEGRRIVPAEWVRHSQILDTSEGSAAHFQYHWWIPFADYPAFMASGHRGQYLYVNPELDLIIVRLGWSRGRLSHAEWRRFLYDLEARLGFRPADPAGSSGPVDLIAR